MSSVASMVKRRHFPALIGAVLNAIPSAGGAQSSRPARVGVLVLGDPDPAQFLNEFRKGLRDLGYVEGQDVLLEFRSANGSMSELQPLARELVARRVDVIVGFQTPAVKAAKDATTEIPIVMGLAGDPVENSLVASLARPGGNVTGVAGAGPMLSGKLLEVSREMLPKMRRVAVMANAQDPFHKGFVAHLESAGRSLGLIVQTHHLQNPGELERAFARSAAEGTDAVVVQPSLPLRQSAETALRHRLPAFSHGDDFVAMGGLASYSADYPAMFQKSATFVDLVLKGRKPADLPVQLPIKFLLVINLKTAAALRLRLPAGLLRRADRVIE